ncbi:MAG: SMC-Scp complex subunit ScpB [Verrucomicrobiaceae bacterium]|nr:SMC-Scp complex subunit ScpB [Verrucomicrobiaceae bacterium]
MELTQIVEALLFSCQEPLSLGDMCRAVKETAKDIIEGGEADDAVKALNDVTEQMVSAAIGQLIEHYEKDGRAFTLVERSTGWRLCARGEYAEWCRALFPGKKPQRLSQPALETLAIIAYRQPITRGGIEAVRGVSVDAMVQQLLDRGLIKIEGRADLPGRPLLYGTTEAFLEHFGVRTVDELPNATELRRIKLPSEESAQAAESRPQEKQLFLEPQGDDAPAVAPSEEPAAQAADAEQS